jgi:hypothetical protein
MNTVDQSVMSLDRERHFLISAFVKDLAEYHSRNGLTIIVTARVFEARKRNPRDRRIVDQVHSIGLDVEGF